jgi:iron complex transport system ATP-binding protein
MTPLLDARGIAIARRLKPCDLIIDRSQMVAVIGPNGGGKTSLLRALARTEDADGIVKIDGQDLDQAGEAQRRHLLAFLPASREASWPVAVTDYVKFGLGVPNAARIGELIELLELGPLADRAMDQTSTGERARAMLGRAIAGGARLLLLDEPLSNLDPYWVLRTMEVIQGEVTANEGAALVSVHDLAMVPRFDRVLLVDAGRIVADGKPAAVLNSEAFKAAFRVEQGALGWTITKPAGRQSSQ